ncbi:gamma subclass chorismate mutase AroQ [Chitinimonas sp. BJB300]|uniref:gamma subclass chorismate mutase AroQ n=1 Tax=Chitinimonas sp. BJB300 TaxID=1559339 RepID=UPI0013044EE7|nr:gamma subclass chorismate mutase AroQ [Chitinimonas sp. BJB300]
MQPVRWVGLLLTCLAVCSLPGHAAPADIDLLIDASIERLQLADTVAHYKHVNQIAIEDLPREALVIATAVAAGRVQGLQAQEVESLFRQQITANKMVQAGLIKQWQAGSAPTGQVPDLIRDVRPRLDQLQTRLLQGLVQSQQDRQQTDCQQRLTQQTKAKVDAKNLDELHSKALTQALSRICG